MANCGTEAISVVGETPGAGVLEGLHIVAKPAGSKCNIACDYCFYLEKEALYPETPKPRMSDEVLARYIDNYVASQPTPVVEFVWQGGEPILMGLEFFERVVALQAPHRSAKTIRNALQTNGMLLDDNWCAFLKQHEFIVGISLDGPKEIHDRYRKHRNGRGTFDEVMRGLRLLQKHGVDFNVMACVGRETARAPLEVYRFFKDQGVEFMQFAPIIERMPDELSRSRGLWLGGPAGLKKIDQSREVTPWTVVPEEYGDFMIAIYEEWVRNDVGKTFVMNFEWALHAWLGNPSPICIHSRQCGRALAIEHTGDVYACDHFVYPEYRLGNVKDTSIEKMVKKSLASGFGIEKETSLPSACRQCEVLDACNGGCPKHRFTLTASGEPGLHYLCAGYKRFFRHIRKYCRVMGQLIENDLPVSMVMEATKGPLLVKLNDR